MVRDEFKNDFLGFARYLLGDARKRYHVAILVSNYTRYEGASRVAEEQAIQLCNNRFSVSAITFNSEMASGKGVEIYILKIPFSRDSLLGKTYRAFFTFNVFKIISVVLKFKSCDLTIVHHGNMVIIGYLLKKFYHSRAVFYNHHVDLEPETSLIRRIYGNVFNKLYWRLIRQFDAIVSVSKYSQAQLKEKAGLDSIVIYNTIRSSFKQGIDGNIARKLHSIGNAPVVLYVGRVVPSKRVDVLINVVKGLRPRFKDLKLIVVGRHYDNNYSKMVKKLGQEFVVFAENVDDGLLPYYYAASDVYATCSILEGYNIPVVEAQACGCPVIAFDIGAHKEVVSNGELINLNDVRVFEERLANVLVERIMGRCRCNAFPSPETNPLGSF